MKNDPNLNKPVTVTELTKILEHYPTKNDLKQELQTAITDALKPLATSITTFKDEILHEIKGLREDHVLITGYKDQIEDHETRIDKLEKVAFPD